MVLSQRERSIAIATGAGVLLALLYWFGIAPYMDARDQLQSQLSKLQDQLDHINQLADRQRALRPVWADMQRGGLNLDASGAESQTYHALLNWAADAGVGVPAIKSEAPKTDRTGAQSRFQIITFHVTVTGGLAAISKLAWSLETASIPLRVNEMQVSPRREGTNDLTAQLTISTLCMLPEIPGAAAGPAGSGGQS